MKQVIENGNHFTLRHLFMLLEELNYIDLDAVVAKYLRVVLEEMQLSEADYTQFCNTLKNEDQKEALLELRENLYGDIYD